MKDVDICPAFDHQPLDDVEAVEPSLAGGHVRQRPAPGWGWPSGAWVTIKGVPAFENPAKGTPGGQGCDPGDLPHPLDCFRADLTQVACLLELTAQAQHQILQGAGVCVGRDTRAAGSVRPVHAIQALRPGPPDPEEDRRSSDPQGRGDMPTREPATKSRHHFPTTLLTPLCFAMAVSLLNGLTAILIPLKVFGHCWHSSVRQMLILRLLTMTDQGIDEDWEC